MDLTKENRMYTHSVHSDDLQWLHLRCNVEFEIVVSVVIVSSKVIQRSRTRGHGSAIWLPFITTRIGVDAASLHLNGLSPQLIVCTGTSNVCLSLCITVETCMN